MSGYVVFVNLFLCIGHLPALLQQGCGTLPTAGVPTTQGSDVVDVHVTLKVFFKGLSHI